MLNELSEESPLLEQDNTSYWVKFAKKITENQNLAIQIGLNILRDSAWGVFSYLRLNYRVTETHNDSYDVTGEWFGQQLWGTLAMGVGCLALWGVCCWNKIRVPFATSLIYMAAAAAAIFTWNLGLRSGIHVGQKDLDMSPQEAAFFASIFTGGLEGPTQFAVITLGTIFRDPEARKRYLSDPKAALKALGIDTILSATIGALPGAMWQIVFAACVIGETGPAAAALLIATTVAVFNLSTSKINYKVSDLLMHISCSPLHATPPLQKDEENKLAEEHYEESQKETANL